MKINIWRNFNFNHLRNPFWFFFASLEERLNRCVKNWIVAIYAVRKKLTSSTYHMEREMFKWYLHHVGTKRSFPLAASFKLVNVADKSQNDSADDGGRERNETDDSVAEFRVGGSGDGGSAAHL